MQIQQLKTDARTFFSAFVQKFNADRTLSLAASLSFYAILSLAPLSVVVLFAFSRLDPSLLDRLAGELNNLMGDAGASAIQNAIDSARQKPITGGLASLASLLVVLISASAMFGEVRSSLAIIFRAPLSASKDATFFRETWDLVRDRLLSMGFALTFVLIMAISLVLSAVVSATAQRLGFLGIELPVSFTLYTGIFTLLFMYGSQTGLPFRDAFRGGALTGALFLLGKSLIGLYIGHSSISSSYGAAGSMVALLAWIYYAVIIVFSGAHVAWLLSKSRFQHFTEQENKVASFPAPKKEAV
jgi:membrane protein